MSVFVILYEASHTRILRAQTYTYLSGRSLSSWYMTTLVSVCPFVPVKQVNWLGGPACMLSEPASKIAVQISKQRSEADASRSSQNSGQSATTSHLKQRQGAPHSSAKGPKQNQNSLSWIFSNSFSRIFPALRKSCCSNFESVFVLLYQ
jgi:hypothetical protein